MIDIKTDSRFIVIGRGAGLILKKQIAELLDDEEHYEFLIEEPNITVCSKKNVLGHSKGIIIPSAIHHEFELGKKYTIKVLGKSSRKIKTFRFN